MSHFSRFFPSVFVATLLLGATPLLHAQYRSIAPPLPPDVLNPTPKYWYIGPQLGVSQNTHAGDFLPECDKCLFADGSGIGIIAGIQIEHLPTPDWGIALKLLYDDKRAEYSTAFSGMRQVVDGSVVDVPVERVMDARIAYFVINPMLELFPIKNLYLLAGPAIGLPMTSQYSVKERMLDPNFVFWSTGTDEAFLQPQEWTDIPDVTAPRIDVRVGIGYNLKLSRSVIFAPEVTYEYPLTNISSDDNWKASAIHGVAVLKFAL
ncbi:MAG: hypothetical protein IPP94_08855 [Ignavibacteria bacterium]|nr:hypothetical protein [Ignavibacteria bacterium]